MNGSLHSLAMACLFVIHAYIGQWGAHFQNSGTHTDPPASKGNRDRRQEINSSHRNRPRQKARGSRKIRILSISRAALQLAVALAGPTKSKISRDALCQWRRQVSTRRRYFWALTAYPACPSQCCPSICHVSRKLWCTFIPFPPPIGQCLLSPSWICCLQT